jgi:flagellar hook-length control protein FliK
MMPAQARLMTAVNAENMPRLGGLRSDTDVSDDFAGLLAAGAEVLMAANGGDERSDRQPNIANEQEARASQANSIKAGNTAIIHEFVEIDTRALNELSPKVTAQKSGGTVLVDASQPPQPDHVKAGSSNPDAAMDITALLRVDHSGIARQVVLALKTPDTVKSGQAPDIDGEQQVISASALQHDKGPQGIPADRLLDFVVSEGSDEHVPLPWPGSTGSTFALATSKLDDTAHSQSADSWSQVRHGSAGLPDSATHTLDAADQGSDSRDLDETSSLVLPPLEQGQNLSFLTATLTSPAYQHGDTYNTSQPSAHLSLWLNTNAVEEAVAPKIIQRRENLTGQELTRSQDASRPYAYQQPSKMGLTTLPREIHPPSVHIKADKAERQPLLGWSESESLSEDTFVREPVDRKKTDQPALSLNPVPSGIGAAVAMETSESVRDQRVDHKMVPAPVSKHDVPEVLVATSGQQIRSEKKSDILPDAEATLASVSTPVQPMATPAQQIISGLTQQYDRLEPIPAPELVRQAAGTDPESLLRTEIKVLRLKLQPESLGDVDITLRRSGGEVKVGIAVSSELTAATLRQDLGLLQDRLISSLLGDTIPVIEISVRDQTFQSQGQNQQGTGANSGYSQTAGNDPGSNRRSSSDRNTNTFSAGKGDGDEQMDGNRRGYSGLVV